MQTFEGKFIILLVSNHKRLRELFLKVEFCLKAKLNRIQKLEKSEKLSNIILQRCSREEDLVLGRQCHG